MSDLLPTEKHKPNLIGQDDLKPRDPNDKQSFWRKAADFIRQGIGLKPLHLAERFAEARVGQEERIEERLDVENRVKLLKAREDYAKAMASIEIAQRDSKGRHDKDRAEAANSQEDAKIKAILRKKLESDGKPPEEVWGWVAEVIAEIELTYGGRVEIEPPEFFDPPQLPSMDSADEDA